MPLKDLFLKTHSKIFHEPDREKRTLDGLVIGVINQKGGCGKTTTAVNLSACLAESGKKVLVIDGDPQGHATLGLGLKLGVSEQNLYNVLMRPEVSLSSIIKTTYHPHLDIAPSNSMLASAQVDLMHIAGREGLLKHKIGSIRSRYDMIIIDCPPSLNLLTINALVASYKLIIPVQAQYYSLDGMSELFETLDVVKRGLNPHLSVLGVVPTLFDRRIRVNHDILKAMREYFTNGHKGIRVFDSVIRSCVSLMESPIYGKPAISYRPNSRGAEDYRNLAREILNMEKIG